MALCPISQTKKTARSVSSLRCCRFPHRPRPRPRRPPDTPLETLAQLERTWRDRKAAAVARMLELRERVKVEAAEKKFELPFATAPLPRDRPLLRSVNVSFMLLYYKHPDVIKARNAFVLHGKTPLKKTRPLHRRTLLSCVCCVPFFVSVVSAPSSTAHLGRALAVHPRSPRDGPCPRGHLRAARERGLAGADTQWTRPGRIENGRAQGVGGWREKKAGGRNAGTAIRTPMNIPNPLQGDGDRWDQQVKEFEHGGDIRTRTLIESLASFCSAYTRKHLVISAS